MHYCLCCLGWPGSVFVSFLFFLFFQRPLPVSRGHFLSLLELLRSRVAPKAIFLLVCASPHWTLNSERCTELTKSSNLNCRFVFFFRLLAQKFGFNFNLCVVNMHTLFSLFFLFPWFTPLPPWSSHQPERSSFCHVRQRGEAWWFSFLFKKKKKCVALTIWAGLQFVLLCFFFPLFKQLLQNFFFLNLYGDDDT